MLPKTCSSGKPPLLKSQSGHFESDPSRLFYNTLYRSFVSLTRGAKHSDQKSSPPTSCSKSWCFPCFFLSKKHGNYLFLCALRGSGEAGGKQSCSSLPSQQSCALARFAGKLEGFKETVCVYYIFLHFILSSFMVYSLSATPRTRKS